MSSIGIVGCVRTMIGVVDSALASKTKRRISHASERLDEIGASTPHVVGGGTASRLARSAAPAVTRERAWGIPEAIRPAVTSPHVMIRSGRSAMPARPAALLNAR
jgi:hypothetical protein